jgi:hypothetical protein
VLHARTATASQANRACRTRFRIPKIIGVMITAIGGFQVYRFQ